MLWDGAFSYASKIDPIPHDLEMYNKFVEAAVRSHVAVGCNVTHKVHLMWKHVGQQMRVAGGLGQKREDWVEKQHQTTSVLRKQYRSTKDKDVRATAAARASHRDTNPDVMDHIAATDKKGKRGPRKDHISAAEIRSKARLENRMQALGRWTRAQPAPPN